MVQQLIAQQRATQYTDFSGSVIRARIPVHEGVLNELLRVALAGSSAIHDLYVVLHDHQRVEVRLTIHKWIFRKRLVLDLVIEPEIVFAATPMIRMWMPPGHHFLRNVAHLLTTLGGGLPRGVRVTGRLLEIDLGVLLLARDLPELAEWLQFMAVETHRGQLLLRIELAVGRPPRSDHAA